MQEETPQETEQNPELMDRVRAMLAGSAQGPQNGSEPPKRRGRPPGSKNRPADGSDPGPKDVPVDDVADTSPSVSPSGRRTYTRRKKAAEAPVTAKQVSNLMVSSHMMAAAFAGPAVMITPEQGDMIGEALIPVLDDFGVVVAGKIVHLLVLAAALAMVEGSVAMKVVAQAQEAAKARRQGASVQSGPPQPQNPDYFPTAPTNPYASADAQQVARELGVEIGGPNDGA